MPLQLLVRHSFVKDGKTHRQTNNRQTKISQSVLNYRTFAPLRLSSGCVISHASDASDYQWWSEALKYWLNGWCHDLKADSSNIVFKRGWAWRMSRDLLVKTVRLNTTMCFSLELTFIRFDSFVSYALDPKAQRESAACLGPIILKTNQNSRRISFAAQLTERKRLLTSVLNVCNGRLCLWGKGVRCRRCTRCCSSKCLPELFRLMTVSVTKWKFRSKRPAILNVCSGDSMVILIIFQ